MSYYRSTPPRGGWSGDSIGLPVVTPVNRNLMILCGVMFAVQLALRLAGIDITPLLGLVPVAVVHGWIWQLASYMFLHANITHILFNLLAMWMFGGDVERHWGGRKYLGYWFVCGVGAGLCVTAAGAPRHVAIPTIGASGAIYGLILAYATLFGERRILWNFLFPIKARTFAWIVFAIAFVSSLQEQGDGVSHVAHLGGMVIGWLYLKRAWRVGALWQELSWRVRRRRFKVMPPNDDDRWIH
ncbi:MAG TPA: rhomboid family intramembrane serine protease [Candidatus Polarisedimenticolaceae bacterium]|nr:rhomboid family intramembrane serine protease [Candidatus Polarisedimenticolaceae bacterium]